MQSQKALLDPDFWGAELRWTEERIAGLVAQRIRERSAVDGVDYSCPIEPGACVAARERYGAQAERLLQPACLEAVRPTRPWWRFWRPRSG